MIEITCDRCDRRIEFADDQAGQKVPCPHCGDINRLPGSPGGDGGGGRTGSNPVDRAVAAGLPPDRGPEQRVMLVRPAMLRARPMVFLGLCAGLVAGLTGLIYGLFAPPAWLPWAGGLVAALCASVLGVWKIITLGAALEITNKRSVMRTGLLRRSSSEVLHDSIRNIQIDQTFWNRVWRVGAIGISSAGQDGIEIALKDLPKPDQIRKTIDLYRPM